MALTDKQEKFCQGIANGKSQRQAYIDAYPSSENWKDHSVDATANKAMRNPSISLRIAELRQQIAEDNQISRNDIAEELKKLGFANVNMRNIRASDKIKALEVLIKMLGYDKIDPANTSKIDEILKAVNSIE